MGEYITKKAAINAVENAPIELFQSEWEEIEEAINTAPAADAVPVVHGRWECDLPTINTYGKLRCSICNWWTLDPSVDCSYNYCPVCGAKMDGGTDND